MPSTVVALMIPAAYLLIVCMFRWALGRFPVWAHPLVAVPAFAGQVILSGWRDALTMLGIGAVALILGSLIAGRVLSGLGVIAIATALAISAPDAAIGLGVGMLLAVGAGTYRTVQVAGLARVKERSNATLLAMGVTPGGFSRPQPDLLPQATDVEQIIKTARDAKRMQLFLPGYLLAGVAGQAVVLFVMSLR